MNFILPPWQLYLVILAGWINRQQQHVIEYLLTENQVLKEKLGKKRILLKKPSRIGPDSPLLQARKPNCLRSLIAVSVF